MNLRRLALSAVMSSALLCGGPMAMAASAAPPATTSSATLSTTDEDAIIYPPGLSVTEKRTFANLVTTMKATGFTPEQATQAFRDLENSTMPRSVTYTDGGRLLNFTPAGQDGPSLTLADPEYVPFTPTAKGDEQLSPDVWAGRGGYRNNLWISFNQTDQAFIKGLGGIAAASAFCAIPAVGWVGCAFIQVATLAATTYLWKNGICTRGRTMYYYSVRGGGTIGCLSGPPKAYY